MKRKATLKVGTLEQFFDEGRRIAKLANSGRDIPETWEISFESAEDLMAYLTPKRVALFEAIKLV